MEQWIRIHLPMSIIILFCYFNKYKLITCCYCKSHFLEFEIEWTFSMHLLALCFPFGEHGVSPLSGKIPFAREQWSPCAATSEDLMHPRACDVNLEKPSQWDAYAPQWRVTPADCIWRKPARSNERHSAIRMNYLKKERHIFMKVKLLQNRDYIHALE